MRTQIAALDNSRVTIPVDIGDGSEIERLRARLEALDNYRLRLDVEVTGTADAVAELRTLDALVDRLDGRNVRLNLDVDGLLPALAQITALSAAIAALGTFGSGSRGVGGLNLGFGGLAGGIASAVQLTVRLGVALAQASAMAFAVAVGGAAITGAYAAAATAVAAVPAALALIAAPVGTVMAGLDGIKRAAATIKPEFDDLRASVSATFERGLIPVFDRLADTFPTLQTGMNRVAESIVGIARRLTEMVATEAGLNRIDTIFQNVATALERISPGIAAITDGFLILASQGRTFDPLITAVNEFGTRFRANVLDLLESGTLDSAFQGLSDMAGIAARGLADLIKNGIIAFAAAAPGMNKGLQSISDFFNRFDWKSLGESVGGVFKGLGEALDRVPQETIDKITAGFEKLSQTFQSEDFQVKLQEIIAGIPTAIAWIDRLSQAFVTIGAYVSVGIQSLEKIGRAFDGLVKIVTGAAQTFLTVGRIIGNPWQAWLDRADITKSFQDAGALIREGFGQLKTEFTTPWPSIGDAAATAAGAAFRKLPPAALEEINKLGGEISSKTSPEVAKAVEAVGGGSANAAERGMSLVPPAAQTGIEPTADAVTQGLAPAEQAVTDATTRIKDGLATGFTGLAAPVATALAGVGTTISTEATKWGPLITTAMGGVNLAIDIGFQSTAAAATTGMGTVGTAITTEGAKWGPLVTTAMGLVNQALDIGFQSMAAAATTGMTLVQTAITNGFLAVGAAVSLAMSTLTNVLVAGFVVMQTAAANGMIGVQTAITAGFAGVNAAAATAMTSFATAIRSGMLGAILAVTDGMLAIRTAMITGWANVDNVVRTAMTNTTTVVQTGMTNIVTAVTTGMTDVETAIRTGAENAERTLTTAIDNMVRALESAVGRFRTQGANMGNALAAGLRSALPAVRAAADALAAEAARAVAARAQINSPSRVFMGLGADMGAGLELGLHDARAGIIREAAAIVDGMNTEFARTDTSSVTAGLDDISSGLHGRVMSESAEVDAALVGAGAGNRVINNVINNYVPDAERGADKASHNLRRLSSLGLFGS